MTRTKPTGVRLGVKGTDRLRALGGLDQPVPWAVGGPLVFVEPAAKFQASLERRVGMRSDPAPQAFARAAPERDQWALDGVALVALDFRESTVGGRTYLEACGIDRDGDLLVLASRRPLRGTAEERADLFASLLARGLRAHVPILVDAGGCALLRRRIRAAWGERAVLLDS